MPQSSDATIYERARRLANIAVWSVSIQRRRLGGVEPEDETFLFRRWADFQFMLVALTRCRRAAMLAGRIDSISLHMKDAVALFDQRLPGLRVMRNVAEHIDDYALEQGRDRDVRKQAFETFFFDDDTYEWLGLKLSATDALHAASDLFDAIKSVQ